MKEFITVYPELASTILLGLFALLGVLAKREFNTVQKHQDNQDLRLNAVDAKLSLLESEIVDAKRDRSGLHNELTRAFISLEKQIDSATKSNMESHAMIVKLIRNGGK